MKIFALTLQDGRVAFMRVLDDEADVDREIARYNAGNEQNPAVSHEEISDAPAEQKAGNRHYRDAIRRQGGVFAIDMPAAREIAQQNIRTVREMLWQKHDAAVTAALAKDDAVGAQEAEAKRQTLRDAPADPRLSRLPQTPGELADAEAAIIKQIEAL